MARKSTGRTGRHTRARSSASSTRSKGSEKKRSKRGASSRSPSSQHGSAKVVSISHGHKESSARGRSSGAFRSAQTRVLTDHDEIRRWAGERGAHPAHVRDTGKGDDMGIIRLEFPGYSGEETLEEIGWDDWFRKFDENGLALVVQERTASGRRSSFNKLVNRETVEAMEESSGAGSRRRRTA